MEKYFWKNGEAFLEKWRERRGLGWRRVAADRGFRQSPRGQDQDRVESRLKCVWMSRNLYVKKTWRETNFLSVSSKKKIYI